MTKLTIFTFLYFAIPIGLCAAYVTYEIVLDGNHSPAPLSERPASPSEETPPAEAIFALEVVPELPQRERNEVSGQQATQPASLGSDRFSGYDDYDDSERVFRRRRSGSSGYYDHHTESDEPDYYDEREDTDEHRRNQAENGDWYGHDNDGDGRTESVHVNGYTRDDGTYVRGHYRAGTGE
jgi:hypothetical protein